MYYTLSVHAYDRSILAIIYILSLGYAHQYALVITRRSCMSQMLSYDICGDVTIPVLTKPMLRMAYAFHSNSLVNRFVFCSFFFVSMYCVVRWNFITALSPRYSQFLIVVRQAFGRLILTLVLHLLVAFV